MEPRSGGVIALNTLDPVPLPAADQRWQGIYFRGNPVRLLARPWPGYVFTGWTGLPGVTTNDVQLLLQGDWTIQARFEPAVPTPATLMVQSDSGGRLSLVVTADPYTAWTVESSSDLASWWRGQTLVTGAHGRAEMPLPAGATTRQFLRLVWPQPNCMAGCSHACPTTQPRSQR